MWTGVQNVTLYESRRLQLRSFGACVRVQERWQRAAGSDGRFANLTRPINKNNITLNVSALAAYGDQLNRTVFIISHVGGQAFRLMTSTA